MAEFVLERLALQTMMATMDSIQPSLIALKSRVVLERPTAHMSRKYLCGTSRLDMSHIIHDVFLSDGKVEMQQVRALIDCCVTSICMAPRLGKRVGLADEQPYITTLGLNGQVIAYPSDS
jgi:hypothetical protein